MRKFALGTKKFVAYILTASVLLYLLSGIYAVPQTHVAVQQRFGEIVNPSVKPGIHYALPWPVGRADKVPAKIVRRILIDDFSSNPSVDSISYAFRQMTGLTPCCISGDNNIVSIVCAIQYTISNPVEYLFKIEDNEGLLRDVVCNSVIKSLARLQVDEILTYGKMQIENAVKSQAQKKLDGLDCGLIISFVELKDVRPLAEVQTAFDDVINAKIDKRKLVNQAQSYRNEEIPRAKAKATRIVQQAQTYKIERISDAQGQAQRFLKQLEAYRQTQDLTKKKLYIDFIRQIFPRIEKLYLVDTTKGRAPAAIRLPCGQ